jgi:hypothetical protein
VEPNLLAVERRIHVASPLPHAGSVALPYLIMPALSLQLTCLVFGAFLRGRIDFTSHLAKSTIAHAGVDHALQDLLFEFMFSVSRSREKHLHDVGQRDLFGFLWSEKFRLILARGRFAGYCRICFPPLPVCSTWDKPC